MCKQWKIHNEQAKVSRQEDEKDTKVDDKEYTCPSAGIQKIIMLPRMPGVKTCIFTRCLVMFQETFAPLGSQTNDNLPMGFIWHEENFQEEILKTY